MAIGDIVFSHVPSNLSAIVCSPATSTKGAICFYQPHYYFYAELYIEISWNDMRWYDGSETGTPWDTSVGKAWDDALDMYHAGGAYPIKYWGRSTLWWDCGAPTDPTTPDSTPGVVQFTSNNRYPYTGGRYYADAWLHDGSRYYVEFKPKDFNRFYRVDGTYSNGGFSGTATVDARGANYSTGNGWDIDLNIIILFMRSSHNPYCNHR